MDKYTSFWYEALASDLGIVIETSDCEALRQRLYKARREAKDNSLIKMSLRIVHNQVWIVKDDPKKQRATGT